MATPQIQTSAAINPTDIVSLLGGNKTTTRGSADTSLISALAPQVLNPADPAALIAALFQQAQGQMPALAAARSNAVGGRTARNSGIVTASDKLLQDTVLKAQQQIMAQEQTRQQIAAQLAASLAGATRSQTTQQGTNLGRAAGMLGVAQAGAKLADTRLGKKATDFIGDQFNSLQNAIIGPDTSIPADNFVLQSSGNIDPNTYGLDAMSTGFDFPSALPDFSGASVAPSIPDINFGSVDPGLADWGNEFTDLIGLKDGGLIGRDDVAQRKAMSSYKPKGYADGGVVRGSAGGRTSSVPSMPESQVARTQARNMSPIMPMGFSTPSTSPATPPSESLGTSDSSAVTGVSGGNPGSIGPAASVGLNVAMGNVPGAITSAVGNPGLSAIASTIGAIASQNPIALVNALIGIVGAINSTGNPAPVNDAVVSDPNNSNIGMVGMGAPTTSDGGIGVGDSSGSAVSAGDGSAVSSGDGGDSTGYANGGPISGPGTTTSDSIPIRVSKGEYIVPADVVQRLGTAFFDNLRANFHMPTAMAALDTDDNNGDDVG